MKNWLYGNLFLFSALFFQRLFFYTQFGNQFQNVEVSEIYYAFWVGVRFDLMVIGYAQLPLVLLLWLDKVSRYQRVYFVMISVILCGIANFDHAYFSEAGDRLNQGLFFPEYKSILMSLPAAVNVLPFLVFFYIKNKIVMTPMNWKFNLGIVFVVAVMIRGSLGAHHLDLRHSEISKNFIVNTLSLNSAYSLDQALRKRR